MKYFAFAAGIASFAHALLAFKNGEISYALGLLGAAGAWSLVVIQLKANNKLW